MNDTPTNNKMTIALLNIPFAIVGIAIAVVPLIIGMNKQAHSEKYDVTASKLKTLDIGPEVKKFENAA